jgi:hypothetical protein
MAKNEHVEALAGVVDSLVGFAGNVVDEARKNIDKVDEYVTKGAVVLTRLVDSLENLDDDGSEDIAAETPTRKFILDELNLKGFAKDYLRTLDLNTLVSLFNKVSDAKSKSWSEFTDAVKTAGQVAEETGPVDKGLITREDKTNYILSRPSAWYTPQMLSTLRDDELDSLYQHYKLKYND